MGAVYSHHCMGYSHGPPVSVQAKDAYIEKLRRDAIGHLMNYLRAAQNGLHSAPATETGEVIEAPADLVRYMELCHLLSEARQKTREVSSSTTPLDKRVIL